MADFPDASTRITDLGAAIRPITAVGESGKFVFDSYAVNVKTNKILAHVSWSDEAQTRGATVTFGSRYAIENLPADANVGFKIDPDALKIQNKVLADDGFEIQLTR